MGCNRSPSASKNTCCVDVMFWGLKKLLVEKESKNLTIMRRRSQDEAGFKVDFTDADPEQTKRNRDLCQKVCWCSCCFYMIIIVFYSGNVCLYCGQ